jgi:hypothetical protein
MLPDETSLRQARVPETTSLLDQLWRDIAALRQLTEDAWELIENVRRRPATHAQARAIGLDDCH